MRLIDYSHLLPYYYCCGMERVICKGGEEPSSSSLLNIILTTLFSLLPLYSSSSFQQQENQSKRTNHPILKHQASPRCRFGKAASARFVCLQLCSARKVMRRATPQPVIGLLATSGTSATEQYISFGFRHQT